MDAIGRARPAQLMRAEGMDRTCAIGLARFFRSPLRAAAEKSADEQCDRVERAGGRIVTFWDEEYPNNLKTIYDPPPLLFVRGEFAEPDAMAVAVVGTRAPSPYGRAVAERIAADLTGRGITVVSGLARGIDTAAHAASLRAGGRTIAVIGSGLDVIYPPENGPLAELGPRLIGIREGRPATATLAGAGQTLFERRLFDLVGDAPLHVDLIAQRSGISAAEAMVHLLALEFKGAVRQLAGKRFVRA